MATPRNYETEQTRFDTATNLRRQPVEQQVQVGVLPKARLLPADPATTTLRGAAPPVRPAVPVAIPPGNSALVPQPLRGPAMPMRLGPGASVPPAGGAGQPPAGGAGGAGQPPVGGGGGAGGGKPPAPPAGGVGGAGGAGGGKPPALTRAATAAGRAAGRVAPIAGRALPAASLLLSANSYKLDDPDVDSSAMGTLRALRDGDADMFRRSVGKGLLETGMDIAQSVAATSDLALPGTPTQDRLRAFLRNRFGDQLIDNSQAGLRDRLTMSGLRPTPPEPPPVRPIAAPENQRVMDPRDAMAQGTASVPPVVSTPAVGTPAAAPDDDNVVTREGNSFEGKNIREGFRYADGRPTGGTFSVVPGFAPAALPAEPVVPGGATGIGAGPGRETGMELRERFNRESAQDTLRRQLAGYTTGTWSNPRIAAQQAAAAAQTLAQMDASASNERVAAQRNAGDTERTRMQNDTLRRNTDVTAAVQREGNQLEAQTRLRGQDMSYNLGLTQAQAQANSARRQAELEFAKLVQEQANKDRTFEAEQDAKSIAQRDAARESATKLAQTLFRDPKTGEVDNRRVADFIGAIEYTLPSIERVLRAQGRNVEADRIRGKHLAGLDATTLAQMKLLYDRRTAGEMGRWGWIIGGLLNVGTQGPMSSNLMDYELVAPDNTMLSRGYLTRGGQSVRLRDLTGTGLNPFSSGTQDLLPTPEEAENIRRAVQQQQQR